MGEKEQKEKEERKRFTLWTNAETLANVEKYRKQDNCDTQSEFIEKAIGFYTGYLSAESNKDYLSNVVISAVKSITAESEQRQSRLLFKLAVELAMVMNLIAASQDVSELDLERLRGECVKEVKRLNGSFSFEDAFRWQRG